MKTVIKKAFLGKKKLTSKNSKLGEIDFVNPSQPTEKNYFYIEGTINSTPLSFYSLNSSRSSLLNFKYSKDKINWTNASRSNENEISLGSMNKDEKLYIRGNNIVSFSDSSSDYSFFCSYNSNVNIGGNLMNLYEGENFEKVKECKYNFQFAYLFTQYSSKTCCIVDCSNLSQCVNSMGNYSYCLVICSIIIH